MASVYTTWFVSAPANLNDRIIFSKRIKTKADSDAKGPSTETDEPNKSQSRSNELKSEKKGKTKSQTSSKQSLLSFTEDDGEEAWRYEEHLINGFLFLSFFYLNFPILILVLNLSLLNISFNQNFCNL